MQMVTKTTIISRGRSISLNSTRSSYINQKLSMTYFAKDKHKYRSRKCHIQKETIGRRMIMGTVYTKRHNIATKIINQAIALKPKLAKIYTRY